MGENMTPEKVYSCELKFRPNIELISIVRRFVASFFECVLRDPDAISRVALVTHELLENAVKYSTNGESILRVEANATAPIRLSITVSNRASPEQIKLLQEIFEEMRGAGDPFVYYQKMMQRSAKLSEGSGLGLARILAEAEMTLDYQLTDDLISIRAQAEVK
jgi:hypothetical protein